MPTLAIVEGVKIQIYAQEHPPPHFHAVFAERRVQVEIGSLRVMNGGLPRRKLALVLSWAGSRQEALLGAWEKIASGSRPEKIA
jgi:hypothetical protein